MRRRKIEYTQTVFFLLLRVFSCATRLSLPIFFFFSYFFRAQLAFYCWESTIENLDIYSQFLVNLEAHWGSQAKKTHILFQIKQSYPNSVFPLSSLVNLAETPYNVWNFGQINSGKLARLILAIPVSRNIMSDFRSTALTLDTPNVLYVSLSLGISQDDDDRLRNIMQAIVNWKWKMCVIQLYMN